MMPSSPTPQALSAAQVKQLETANGLLQAGKASEALAIGHRLNAETAHAPDVHQLLAIGHAQAGNVQEAEKEFRCALEFAPNSPLLLANYATLLRRLGRLQEAIAALDRAVDLQPDAVTAWHALGNARRANDDLEASEAAFRKAVALTPNYGSAWFNLGSVLRLLGRVDEIIPCYERAKKTGHAGPELDDALTGALIDNGRLDEALEQARRLTHEQSDFVPGHVTLAQLLWECGPAFGDDSAIATFDAAVQRRPQNRALRMEYARFLLMARMGEQALAQIRMLQGGMLQGGTQQAGDHDPVLIFQEADALEMLGRSEQAGALYARLHRTWGKNHPALLNAYTRHLLKAGQWAAAAEVATEATRIDSNNQAAWALLGTAWRLLDDPREHWLCDYERLIGLVEVEAPEGYAGMPEFLRALQSSVLPLHQAIREPVQQSLRGGSQTPGRLFGRRDPVIAAAQATLLRAVEHWLARLPSDSRHPFLMRKTRSVRFAGSWSVRLWSSGNHVNHIHQQGWMSSAFYVSLPPSIAMQSAADQHATGQHAAGQHATGQHAGHIQFGQPPLELGLDLPPRRIIRPEPGKLALFPSFMWHGTVPFEDAQPRLSIAFDMTPSRDVGMA